MQENYCTIPLDPAIKADILAACIQADAAIQAAQIQSGSARFAGWMTITAGTFAILGGASAYWAATRQVRLWHCRQTRWLSSGVISPGYA